MCVQLLLGMIWCTLQVSKVRSGGVATQGYDHAVHSRLVQLGLCVQLLLGGHAVHSRLVYIVRSGGLTTSGYDHAVHSRLVYIVRSGGVTTHGYDHAVPSRFVYIGLNNKTRDLFLIKECYCHKRLIILLLEIFLFLQCKI